MTTANPQEFAYRLNNLICALDMDYREFAQHAHIPYSTLMCMLNCSKSSYPSFTTLRKLARAVGVRNMAHLMMLDVADA